MFAIFLLCLLSGCPGSKSLDSLTLTKGKLCLKTGGKEQCMETAGTYRLRLKDGVPSLEPLNTKELGGELSFPQFSRPDAIKAERLGVIIENKVLSLSMGEKILKDSTGLGFLIQLEANGAMRIATGQNVEIAADKLDIYGGKRFNRIDLKSQKPVDGFFAITRTEFEFQGEANRYVPNDTGTIVIIIDNFKIVGDCNAAAPDSCCPASEGPGPDVTVTDNMINDYAADGLRLLTCFPVNSICTFTHGDKLIVIECASQRRYCIDLSICEVTITTTDDNGICISVATGCDLENPFD
jgi:hypothetical protein